MLREKSIKKVVTCFFKKIDTEEFKDYMFDLTSDAMLGAPDNNQVINSNRVFMLKELLEFMEDLKKASMPKEFEESTTQSLPVKDNF